MRSYAVCPILVIASTCHVLAADMVNVPERCGAMALSVCLACLGQDVDVDSLDEAMGKKGVDTSMLDLKQAAEGLSLHAVGLQWQRNVPAELLAAAPAVAPVRLRADQPHFVAVVGAEESRLLIVDLPHDPVWVDDEVLRSAWGWNGYLLHVSDDSELLAQYEGRTLRSWIVIVAGTLLAMAALTLLRRPTPASGPMHCLTAGLSVWLCVLTAGCGGDESAATVPAGQAIIIDPNPLEVSAKAEELVNASINLRNNSGGEVRIAEVRTSCGCMTVAGTSSPTLKAGESAVVAIRISPLTYGHRDAWVEVRTDRPAEGRVRIPVRINGPPLEPPYIRHHPPRVVLNPRTMEHPNETVFRISCVEKTQAPPWLRGCVSPLTGVSFDPPQVIEEEPLDVGATLRQYEILVRLDSGAIAEENVKGRASFDVASTSMRPLPTLIIEIDNRQLIECVPAALTVSPSSKPGTERKIVVRSRDGSAFKVMSVRIPEANVDVRFDPEQEADTHVLRLEVRTIDGTTMAAIRTDHPECPDVAVKLVATSS